MSVLDEIRIKAEQAKKVTESENEKEANDKIRRTIDAIADKAIARVTGWLANEPEMIKRDIRSFFLEGTDDKGLVEYLADGCGLYFGRVEYDALASKDFGPYVMALEASNPGSHFPYVLKINVRSGIKLNKVISKYLGVEHISRDVVEELLKFEKMCKLPLNFVSAEAFSQFTKFNFEPFEVAKTEAVIGKETVIPVTCYVAVIENKVYLTRDDWYEGHVEIPTEPILFDMRYVHTPRKYA